jgi:endonuclease G, mitochondrial
LRSTPIFLWHQLSLKIMRNKAIPSKLVKSSLSILCLTAFLFSNFLSSGFGTLTKADNVAQPIPLSQDWSNTNLITVSDDWSGVPGIIGYRGDGLTAGTGIDPQTILSDGSGTPVDVNANQINPDTFSTGGVSEFDALSNPVVALQGSATAAAPHIVANLNTVGKSGVNVSYNLRDIDGSADNAIQPVALQYRVGATGNYTNIPAGFVPDATSGPNLATLVTHVSVSLPAACDNQALVQIRIITTNAVGNDEWVGIDDLNFGGSGGTVLSGSGQANPNNVSPGGNTLLTITVTPASSPTSSGIQVFTNLSAIGGSAAQQFFDDGTNGDVVAGDNTFSYVYIVPTDATGGNYSLAGSISDAQARTATATISITVVAPPDPNSHLTLGNPTNAVADVNVPDNYLMVKPQYVLSYNRDKGEPNWVSWHLDSSWLGSAPRQDDFRPDPSLPAGWYHVQDSDYSNSGFDRGHMCPSADRTSSVADNSATFLMTNFVPQAPSNNQGPWEQLESYLRDLVLQGNEIYIVAGGAGIGGTGTQGGITTTIASGHVTVPAYTWKIAVVIPNGNNDLDRLSKTTRVISVAMPNSESIGRSTPWRSFRVTVKSIEALTGDDFFSNVRPQVRRILKQKIDQQ